MPAPAPLRAINTSDMWGSEVKELIITILFLSVPVSHEMLLSPSRTTMELAFRARKKGSGPLIQYIVSHRYAGSTGAGDKE